MMLEIVRVNVCVVLRKENMYIIENFGQFCKKKKKSEIMK